MSSVTGTAPPWVDEISLTWGAPAISHSDPIRMGVGVDRCTRRMWVWLLDAGKLRGNFNVSIADHGAFHGVLVTVNGPNGTTEWTATPHGTEPSEAAIRQACVLAGLPVSAPGNVPTLADELDRAKVEIRRLNGALGHAVGVENGLRNELAAVREFVKATADLTAGLAYCGEVKVIDQAGRWPKPGDPPVTYVCLHAGAHPESTPHDWRRVGWKGRGLRGSLRAGT